MPLDVFQDGLKRGAERLPFAPHKRYFYVEHPEEGWRVYLRACTFIHEQGAPFDPRRFIVVKTTGGDPAKKEWEPPKGQMEGKDTDPKKSIYDNLVENVHREVEEEAKITKLVGLKHTGLVFQAREKDYPPNTFFQYHIFQAFTPVSELKKAAAEFEWIQGHMEEFMKIKKDKREKDAIAWYSNHTKLMGRWSPKIVPMYLRLFS